MGCSPVEVADDSDTLGLWRTAEEIHQMHWPEARLPARRGGRLGLNNGGFIRLESSGFPRAPRQGVEAGREETDHLRQHLVRLPEVTGPAGFDLNLAGVAQRERQRAPDEFHAPLQVGQRRLGRLRCSALMNAVRTPARWLVSTS